MRVAIIGDLHFGAGTDLGRVPPERLMVQQLALYRAIDVAIDHGAERLILAGDVFHHARPTPREMKLFAMAMRKWAGSFRVIVGNHDVQAGHLPTAVEVLFPEETFRRPEVEDGIGYLPWAPVTQMLAEHGVQAGSREAASLLEDLIRAQVAEGARLIVAHWALSGAILPTGMPTDSLREPIIRYDDLPVAIIAGHIHTSSILRGAPFVGHVGSLCPVDFGEENVAHQIQIVDIPEARAEPLYVRAIAVPPHPPLRTVGLDWTAELVEGAIVRVRYEATEDVERTISHSGLRQALLDAGAHHVYAIQPKIIRAERQRADVDETMEPLDAMRTWCDTQAVPADDAETMLDATREHLHAHLADEVPA